MILSGASLTFKNDVLKHFFCNMPVESPPSLYVGLFESDETGGLGAELSGGGYARQQVKFVLDNAGGVKNTADIEFPPATDDWGKVSYTAVFDTETEGEPLVIGKLLRERDILQGDIFTFLAGDYQIKILDEEVQEG